MTKVIVMHLLLCVPLYTVVHNYTITKSIRLGKKVPNKHRSLLLCLENEDDKLSLLSRSHLLCHSGSYEDIFIVPKV